MTRGVFELDSSVPKPALPPMVYNFIDESPIIVYEVSGDQIWYEVKADDTAHILSNLLERTQMVDTESLPDEQAETVETFIDEIEGALNDL